MRNDKSISSLLARLSCTKIFLSTFCEQPSCINALEVLLKDVGTISFHKP